MARRKPQAQAGAPTTPPAPTEEVCGICQGTCVDNTSTRGVEVPCANCEGRGTIPTTISIPVLDVGEPYPIADREPPRQIPKGNFRQLTRMLNLLKVGSTLSQAEQEVLNDKFGASWKTQFGPGTVKSRSTNDAIRRLESDASSMELCTACFDGNGLNSQTGEICTTCRGIGRRSNDEANEESMRRLNADTDRGIRTTERRDAREEIRQRRLNSTMRDNSRRGIRNSMPTVDTADMDEEELERDDVDVSYGPGSPRKRSKLKGQMTMTRISWEA